MKAIAVPPAELAFQADGTPFAPAYGDVYHARAGAAAQARHVFLGGNGLPQRWQGRPRFVILETGFGLGNNFLATWQAWRQDPARCERLVFVSLEKHPARREDLARAHTHSEVPELAAALVAQWPPLTAGLHRLNFDDGRVVLQLGLGDARALACQLVLQADAFYLDGFAPDRNPELWDAWLFKHLARLAGPQATAATWSVARVVRDGLSAAGFEVSRAPGFGSKGQMTQARYSPRHLPRRPAGREPLAPDARRALVLGAGLAGAACALALSREGVACTVVDRLSRAAGASSGNPAGLFHGTVNPQDGLHARFNRAAALATQAVVRELRLPHTAGLLRLETRLAVADMPQAPGYVQALDAAQASRWADTSLSHPAWCYPGGGALDPAAYTRAMLRASGAELKFDCPVHRLAPASEGWALYDANGHCLGTAPLLVLAGGHGQVGLWRSLPALSALLDDLTLQRGQLSHLAEAPWCPPLPVAGDGYTISDGRGGVWCGATTQDDDEDPALRPADHALNLQRYARLAGLPAVPDAPLAGRVGWRLLAPDRLPLIGGLAAPGPLAAQLRLQARLPGLVLCTAMGSRGITWAALAGQMVAALALGRPQPVEADLLDAVDPQRQALRRARRTTIAGLPA